MPIFAQVNENDNFAERAGVSNCVGQNNLLPFLNLSMTSKEEMGESLKAIRRENKLTQKQVAEKLKVGRRTIQYLESGENFNIVLALKYLDLFGYQVGYIKSDAMKDSIITKI